MAGDPGFRVGVDIGGTFIDYMAQDLQTGRVLRTKGLSGATDLGGAFTGALAEVGVGRDSIKLLMHATTVVTNLILERDGARVGLITTRGFRDVLEIGWSLRDDAYDLQWRKFVPLVARPLRLEVDERTTAAGEIERPLDEDQVVAAARELAAAGVEAIAVCFLHAYAAPINERRARDLVAAACPGLPCVISSDVDPRIGEYERVSTTVLSAYAMPRLREYVDGIERWIGPGRGAYFMQSEGGAIPSQAAVANPTALVMSGPAAGVLGACRVGVASGHPNLITMDVGGTSTDVCIVVDGSPGVRDQLEIEPGVPLRSPSLEVVSVGAGGGSIARVDEGGVLSVGPQSAGAHPGPACYGAGGHDPTVTDANVVLGLTDADGLLGGRLGGDRVAAVAAMSRLAADLGVSVGDAAIGVYRIANATMAQAIRALTVQRGIDPRDFAMVAFGGAGGQHAIEVAREMEIGTVVFPPYPSTFSAFGLLTADVQSTRTRALVAALDAIDPVNAEARYASLERQLDATFKRITEGDGDVAFTRFADLRYRGQVHSLRTPVGAWSPDMLAAAFRDRHELRHGTRLDDPIEVLNLGVTARLGLDPRDPAPPSANGRSASARAVDVLLEDGPVPVIPRAAIGPAAAIPTPCLIEEPDSRLYLPSGTLAEADEQGNVVCRV